SVPMIVLASMIGSGVVAQTAGSFTPPAPVIATSLRFTGPLRTLSAGAKFSPVDVAATEIASGAAAGEPTVPSPNWSRSFPAATTGTTPASETLDRLEH